MILVDRSVGNHRFVVASSERDDGDLHPERVDADVLRARQRTITGRTWSMVDQVHGTLLHDVTPPTGEQPIMAATADVQRCDLPDRHVAMWAADCAVIVLAGASGRFVAAHAGWRGLVGGVIDVAVDALDEPATVAALGPTIAPCCYEFGSDDLSSVAAGVGIDPSEIAGQTTDHRPALDVEAAVRAGLRRRGIELDAAGPCTGCDSRWFSHRVGAEPGRHATIAYMETSDTTGNTDARVDR